MLSACNNSDEPEPIAPTYDYGDKPENVWDPAYGFIPEDWTDGNYSERIGKLALPSDFLEGLSTMNLLRVSLSFPYMYDFIFYETVDKMARAIETRTTYCTGFELLREREDAFDCMLDYYEGVINEIYKGNGETEFSVFHLPMCEFYIGTGQLCALEKLPKSDRMMQLAIRAMEVRNDFPEYYNGCNSLCGLYRLLSVCGFDVDAIFEPGYHW